MDVRFPGLSSNTALCTINDNYVLLLVDTCQSVQSFALVELVVLNWIYWRCSGFGLAVICSIDVARALACKVVSKGLNKVT